MSEEKSKSQTLEQTETLVVETCLRSTCCHETILEKNQNNARKMSLLMTVEASIYIHYSLTKRWKDGKFKKVEFCDYYYYTIECKKFFKIQKLYVSIDSVLGVVIMKELIRVFKTKKTETFRST